MGTVTPKQRAIDICKELHALAQEHPVWGAPLKLAADHVATKYRIPKKDRLWEGTKRRIPRSRKAKKNAKNVEVPVGSPESKAE